MLITILIFLLLLSCAGCLYYFYHSVFWVKRSATMVACKVPSGEQYAVRKAELEEMIRTAEAIPYEEVTIRSHDGLLLYGRYYAGQPGAPIQIQMHGYRSNPLRDFSGGLQLALKNGQSVLLVSQRCHERSEGKCLTFGIQERKDCMRWAQYARERFGAQMPIFLAGISMGAATVLMASELDLPDNVRGIIADCPYSSPEAIIKETIRSSGRSVGLYYPITRLTQILFGGVDFESASPVEAVKHAKVPLLLIHGEDDRFVPCDMSREIYAACTGKARLVTIPNAGHALSYVVDGETYAKEMNAFIAECLANQ